MPNGDEKLYLKFHGRIIDSLGIQMYQSPVAAVAGTGRGSSILLRISANPRTSK